MLLAINLEKLTGDFITPEKISLIIRVILILVIGIPLIRLIRSITKRIVKNRLSPQSEQLVVRSVYYVAVLILLITLLNEFGFRLSASTLTPVLNNGYMPWRFRWWVQV